ncbi:hypothetical protein [Bradyrhizobium commune]|uniref:Uncharacterized protein n=1 Tax=Bradyrhizobium commune TaxID=83627 RepID=A0A7S9D5A8_9BRAD|nr:hypothetical protein [Bradyrhizobium commune]QPF91477.1 hypothetical protein IC761_34420 [Bradyrhizobium commune]
MINIFDQSGSRVRRDDQLSEELLALPEEQRDLATKFLSGALDCEEISDELHQAERELRRLQSVEDAAIVAAAKAGPAQEFYDAHRAVIAANS